jgi:hypothetical protein
VKHFVPFGISSGERNIVLRRHAETKQHAKQNTDGKTTLNVS